MKVQFVSRRTAKDLIKTNIPLLNDSAIISISTLEEQREEMTAMMSPIGGEKCPFIAMVFLDLDNEDSRFTDDMARDIIGFVEWQHRKNKNIIVHCDMGVSRSGAVAKWVNEFLGLQDLYLEDYQQYNRYVFNKLCECSGVKTLKSYYKDLEENS